MPPDVMCRCHIEHPDYAELTLYLSTAKPSPGTYNGVSIQPLPLMMTLRKTRNIPIHAEYLDTGHPAAGISVDASQEGLSGSGAWGTTGVDGKIVLKLPPGDYTLVGNPQGTNYIRTYRQLKVDETPAEQPVTLQVNPGCVLTLKAIDADTGLGIPGVTFWYEKEGPQWSRWQVQSHEAYVDNPVTNAQGELRAVVVPGKRRYGVGFSPLPNGYTMPNNSDRSRGRELDLPAGQTIVEEFKLRKP